MPQEHSKNTILVIDDEEEFREAAVRIAAPLLPDNWEIEAPDTLSAAIEIIHTRVVRLMLIDRNISGDGYQPLGPDGIEVENTSGIQIASWIQRDFPHIRRVAYSKGGLGCAQFNGYTDTKFTLKQYLNEESHTGDEARTALANFIQGQIEIIENEVVEK